MNKVYFQGEVTIFSGAKIPKGAKKVESKDNYILANSETTGNHHVLVCQDGVDVYEKDGTLYVHVENEAHVECVMKDRHDTQVLPAGDYEIGRAFEYDHLAKTRRVVAD
jgi:hypothetical protein